MIDLFKITLVPFSDPNISRSALVSYAGLHLAKVAADPVAPEVAAEVAAVRVALAAVEAVSVSAGVKLGLQKSRVGAKRKFRLALPEGVSRIYGAGVLAFGRKSPEMKNLFPTGRVVFARCAEAELGNRLEALHTAVAGYAAEMGAAALSLATSLRDQWHSLHTAAVSARGARDGEEEARRVAFQELRNALTLLYLEIGKQLLNEPERAKHLFPQAELGFPLKETTAASAPEPLEP